jgi:hypothetical protein
MYVYTYKFPMSISEETLEETLAPSVCKEVLEQEVWIIVDHRGSLGPGKK